MMRRQILISLLILLFMQVLAEAEVLYVPSRTYPTIQDALDDAGDYDVVEVAPGVYTGDDNRDLDFGGWAITLKSQINPANPNWDIIAATVIDCGGNTWTVQALSSGKTYYWRVKIRDVATGDAIQSPWSWSESFTVKAGLPVVRKD